jgi:hypothetical protein
MGTGVIENDEHGRHDAQKLNIDQHAGLVRVLQTVTVEGH